MRMGIDLGGTNLKTGLFDEDGSVVDKGTYPVSGLDNPYGLWESVCGSITGFQGNREITRAGLSVKGLISEEGVMCDDIGLGNLLRGINLKLDLESKLGVPVSVANDARASGWGEYRFGAGQGSTIMVCLTLGTGLGCSVVSHGKPWMGKDPTSGILGGHICIDRNGPECLCGNRGCFEGYCSATAFRNRVTDRHPGLAAEPDPIIAFFAVYKQDPATYFPVLKSWIDDMALGIVSLIHTTGADTVVIGGGLTESADQFLPALRQEVHKRAWTWPRCTVRIEIATLRTHAAALGAAFLNETGIHT